AKVFTAINVSKGNNVPTIISGNSPNSMGGTLATDGSIGLDEVVVKGNKNQSWVDWGKDKLNNLASGKPIATVGTEVSVSSDTKSLIFIVLAVIGGFLIIPKLIK
ncbi:MAG: hypothetical protein WBJ10_12540, partial [Daejeonella sp.]|uniref:hypothetical protein n=1 Tax=Daejeonella sp. TaxID=2805397 RepID=UPI003C73BEC8